MRDVVLVRASCRARCKALVDLAGPLLARHHFTGAVTVQSWLAPSGRFALVRSLPSDQPRGFAWHTTASRAIAYSGHTSAEFADPAAILGLIEPRAGGFELRQSPGGIAAFFHIDDHRQQAYAWASHGNMENVFVARAEDALVLSNRPVIASALASEDGEPCFSETWARESLVGGYPSAAGPRSRTPIASRLAASSSLLPSAPTSIRIRCRSRAWSSATARRPAPNTSCRRDWRRHATTGGSPTVRSTSAVERTAAWSARSCATPA